MKHLIQFEKWSPKFNRTLQGAYQQAEVTNKGFGKSAKSVLDYANRSISQEVFTMEFSSGGKLILTLDPEFILKPIQTFIKKNGNIFEDKNSLTIPIIPREMIFADGSKHSVNDEGNVIMFEDGKIRWNKIQDTDGKIFIDELRFSDRKGLENFFAMIIQAVLSSPEKSQANPFRNLLEDLFPGDTVEKQKILKLIQRLILDKDHRQYTM